jgi:5-methylcytosine-specific restriction endonuclease McrA
MASRKKRRTSYLPWWLQRHLGRRAKFAKLKEIHGDRCWRCNHPMRFEGLPNCGKAATIEHLVPRSKGGTWALDNLRLCHVGCNRYLADRPPEQKERMRINQGAVPTA